MAACWALRGLGGMTKHYLFSPSSLASFPLAIPACHLAFLNLQALDLTSLAWSVPLRGWRSHLWVSLSVTKVFSIPLISFKALISWNLSCGLFAYCLFFLIGVKCFLGTGTLSVFTQGLNTRISLIIIELMKVTTRLVAHIKCYVNMSSLYRENSRFMCTVNRYVKTRFEWWEKNGQMARQSQKTFWLDTPSTVNWEWSYLPTSWNCEEKIMWKPENPN